MVIRLPDGVRWIKYWLSQLTSDRQERPRIGDGRAAGKPIIWPQSPLPPDPGSSGLPSVAADVGLVFGFLVAASTIFLPTFSTIFL